jgi:hypothetical protein
MNIISLIFILALIGVAMWAINTYLPMAQPWKTLINVVAVILTIFWLLSIFGLMGAGPVIGGSSNMHLRH